VAEQGRGAIFFAGETSIVRVVERALAIEGRLSVDDIRRGELAGEMRAKLDAAAARLRGVLPAVERMPAGPTTLSEDLARRSGVQLAIVDPLQMLARGEREQDEELAAAVRHLKATAVDLNVAILATAHRPTLTSRPDRRPQLDDFGALGAVKQHADVVLGLFREEMYDNVRDLEGATELHVLKNRSGALGYADLYFYAQWMRFEDLVEPDR
jgi:replicative DNA helicase